MGERENRSRQRAVQRAQELKRRQATAEHNLKASAEEEKEAKMEKIMNLLMGGKKNLGKFFSFWMVGVRAVKKERAMRNREMNWRQCCIYPDLDRDGHCHVCGALTSPGFEMPFAYIQKITRRMERSRTTGYLPPALQFAATPTNTALSQHLGRRFSTDKPVPQLANGQMGQLTNGPMGQQTNGPMGQQANTGPMGQLTNGPMGQLTNGPMGQPTIGQMGHQTSTGPMGQRAASTGQLTNAPMGQLTNGVVPNNVMPGLPAVPTTATSSTTPFSQTLPTRGGWNVSERWVPTDKPEIGYHHSTGRACKFDPVTMRMEFIPMANEEAWRQSVLPNNAS